MFGETSARFTDPYEAMRFVPIPGWLRTALQPQVETLAHLLSFVLSAPSHVPDAQRGAVADFVTLCAAAIVAPQTIGAEDVIPGTLPNGRVIVNDAWQELHHAALEWCSAYLPSLKFDVAVEAAIRSASTLREAYANVASATEDTTSDATVEAGSESVALKPVATDDDDENEPPPRATVSA
jgi:hypothetical protein